MNHHRATGFTIVEIVIALVIVSIMAAVVMGRFSSGDSFTGFVIRDQIISLARTAQQSSLGRASVALKLNVASDVLTITTEGGNGGVQDISTVSFDLEGISLTGDVNVTDSCSASQGSVIGGSDFTVRFGELGDLGNSGLGAGSAVTSAVRLCLDDNPAESVCISPSGYAYEGKCDD